MKKPIVNTFFYRINNIMNVLILTPDRTGSTLLQRVLTVYMQINNFDKPVINLHELINGLAKCYSNVSGKIILVRLLPLSHV